MFKEIWRETKKVSDNLRPKRSCRQLACLCEVVGRENVPCMPGLVNSCSPNGSSSCVSVNRFLAMIALASDEAATITVGRYSAVT